MLDSLATDLVGQTIAARYLVESVIGHGGQGVVYRAHDRQARKAVAIKMLSLVAARDPQATGRFLREQAALQALAGTAAVQVLDAGETGDGGFYLALELLEGCDLERELDELEARSAHFDLRRVATLMSPVAETLDAAHAQGIFHRDLKPANIFLVQGGGVRLLDFGFARLRSAAPLTAAGTIVGSPSYIAPEVWLGRPELLDHRVDVYSLAVILFRMLSGSLPFKAKEPVEVLKMATTGQRPSLHALRPDLPPRVDRWVEQALAIEADRRYSSTGQCLEQLFVNAGAARVLASAREALHKPKTAQQASAAARIAAVLENAAAALKRWARKDAKPAPKNQRPSVKPRTRSLPGMKAVAKSRSRAMSVPKMAAQKKKAPRRQAPPPPRAVARPLSPPARTKPARNQAERPSLRATKPERPSLRAAAPAGQGKLPPPPALPRKRSKG